MNKLLITIILFGITFILSAQNDSIKQEILELSNSELESMGVLMKGKQIIINNQIPDLEEKFQLIVEGNNYSPFFDSTDNFPVTKFDFYPYYITNMDSIRFFLCIFDSENVLKRDPLFTRKMMLEYLVPVRIKQSDAKEKWGDDLLYWFTPTESFCKALPERYKITRRYTTDSNITSDVAIILNDEELKNIGFVINENEIYLNTFKHGKDKSKLKDGYVVSWFNNKTDCGSSIASGRIDIKEYTFPKDLFYADYHIVRVSFVNGSNNLTTKYKGRAIPIFVKNSDRNFSNKMDVVIYLKYTPELIQKLPLNCSWWKMPDVYTVILK